MRPRAAPPGCAAVGRVNSLAASVVFLLVVVGSGRGVASSVLSAPSSSSGAAAPSPPNFLWVMSDDLGYGEVSWTPGPRPNRNLTTPHVDALARSGMSFVQAYAGSPVCAPSRGTLMTGKHTGHATIRGNHAYDGSDFPLAADDVTFLSVLQAHGYATACVGKWGMGWIGSTGDPSVKGCETYFGVLDQNDAHDMYPSEASYTNRFPASNGSRVWELVPFPANANASRAACMAAGSTCVWSHELWTEAALAALASLSAAQPPRPFFLYLSYTDPHAGGWSGSEEEGNPVPSDGAFAGAPWPTVEVDHASVIVNYQDRDVGALVAAVAAAGIANTTAIIFASDNGASNEGGHDYAFFDSSGPLRGFKRCLTEGGTRTPLVVSLPGTIAPGVVSNFTTAFWDMGDTILDLAGVPPAAWLNQDGRSIKHVLLSPDGRGTPGAPPHIQYTEFCTAVHPPLEPRQGVGWGHSVVNGSLKLLSFFVDQPLMLYDLSSDIYEVNNIAAQHPEIVAEMEAYAKSQHVDSAIFPIVNCTPS